MLNTVTIANPIYDTVFKHLMNNQEVARGLISTLLGVEIASIQPRPQEVTDVQFATPLQWKEMNLRVFRLDFTAEITLKEGGTRKVIIELQKAGKSEALLRFRNYLGSVYQGPDRDEQGRSLPILAIYILGFLANSQRPALVIVKNGLVNGVTGENLAESTSTSAPSDSADERGDDHFFEALTHEAAFVQIPLISKLTGDTEVEQALRLFNQSFANENKHFLILSEKVIQCGPRWLQQAFRVLQTVVSDDEIQKGMAVEDQFYEAVASMEKQLEAERQQKEAAMAREEAAMAREVEERRQKEVALGKAEAAERELAELRRLLEGK